MIFENSLMRLFGQMGYNPWQQNPLANPNDDWFNPMPFEGGIGAGGPKMGAPMMGMNMLAQMNPLLGSGGARKTGMGIRQRY